MKLYVMIRVENIVAKGEIAHHIGLGFNCKCLISLYSILKAPESDD